jgi:hypothetical protein
MSSGCITWRPFTRLNSLRHVRRGDRGGGGRALLKGFEVGVQLLLLRDEGIKSLGWGCHRSTSAGQNREEKRVKKRDNREVRPIGVSSERGVVIGRHEQPIPSCGSMTEVIFRDRVSCPVIYRSHIAVRA